MTLDSLTVGMPGQASAPPAGQPSPAPGPDADILAFLQAMTDAHTSADAGVAASEPTIPVLDGATAAATGISPALAVVSPWSGGLAQLLHGRAPRATTDAEPADDPATDESALDDDEAASAAYLVIAAMGLPVPPPPVDAAPIETAEVTATSDVAADDQISAAPLLNGSAMLPLGGADGAAVAEPSAIRPPAVAPAMAVSQELQTTDKAIQLPRRSGDQSGQAEAMLDGAHLSRRIHAFARALEERGPLSFTKAEPPQEAVVAVAAPRDSVVSSIQISAPQRVDAVAPHVADEIASSSPSVPRLAPSVDTFILREHGAAPAPLVDAVLSSTPGGRHDGAGGQSSSFRGQTPPIPAIRKGGLGTLPFIAIGSAIPAPSLSEAEVAGPNQPRLPNEAGVASTLIRSMQLQYRNGIGSAVVNLDPGYLGEVSVALQINRGVVTATLNAANADVRAWMQANESVLRQGLTDQGLSLHRLIVAGEERGEDRASADGRRGAGQEQEPPRQKRAQRPDETSTFTVVV